MKIELKPIKLKDLFQGYKDDAEEGVVAYGGLLDVRPKYQREFVYKDEQRDAVIDTVRERLSTKCNVLGEKRRWWLRGVGRAAAHA